MSKSSIYFAFLYFLHITTTDAAEVSDDDDRNIAGTIAFSTVGRAQYAFDIYSLSVVTLPNPKEELLTDEVSVNYNGRFLNPSASQALLHKLEGIPENQADQVLVFISERYGLAQIFFNFFHSRVNGSRSELVLYSSKSLDSVVGFSNHDYRREALDSTFESEKLVPLNLDKNDLELDNMVYMKDSQKWMPLNLGENGIKFDDTVPMEDIQKWGLPNSVQNGLKLYEAVSMTNTQKGDAPNLFPNSPESDDSISMKDKQLWVPPDLAKDGVQLDKSVSMKDRPTVVGSRIVYVSTHLPSGLAGQSWAAVYSTDLSTGETLRLSPDGIGDFSPSVSPSGEWVVVASFGPSEWHGQIEDLQTDLYIFNASDGSSRQLAIRNGGWPSWFDNHTVFFHRKSDGGWWSIYRASFSGPLNQISQHHVTVERITPPGLHAFTPASSLDGEWIAVATRRPDTEYRHIEIYNLSSKSFVQITRHISPQMHHLNPFVSYNSERIGYHRCRGSVSKSSDDEDYLRVPILEHVKSPLNGISLFRIDGEFPSFSADGSMIAYISMEGNAIYVMRVDDCLRYKVFSGSVFGLAWDWKKTGVIYTSHGPDFASLSTKVDIIALDVNDIISRGKSEPNSSYKKLTSEGNNAFPSPSPDGRHLVFRSGRSGYKNLYIMDLDQDEEGSLWRLTDGPWTDTQCSWSPDGNLIAFSSDRDNPGSDSFALYLIHPNGTGLKKVLNSSKSGKVNHPFFSPDSKSLIFTSDYTGISAEPISVPHQFGPYGEIFMSKIDGSDVQRLTHNAYEDGTPSWGKKFVSPSDLMGKGEKLRCDFEDDRWLKGNVELLGQSRC